MPSIPLCKSYKARSFVEDSLTSLLRIPSPPQSFIPPVDSERLFFSRKPVAYVNCAFSDGLDAGVSPSIRLLTSAAAVKVTNDLPYSNINNIELDDFVSSYRWHAKKLAYEVEVPKPGFYDVTLIFAETDVKFHGASMHLMTIEVEAVETHVKMDLNVFHEVGSNTPYVLCFSGVEVQSSLTITVYSTHDDGYAKLNGFIVTEFDEKHTNPVKSTEIITVLDCGNARFDWDGPPSNVTLQAYENSDLGVTPYNVGSVNPLLAGLAMSARMSSHPLGYEISVEKPGRYDVSLCFSELKLVQLGKRKFDVLVGALDVFQKTSLDVYSEAGMYTPYVLTAKDLRVNEKISVRLTGDLMGPIISGIIVSRADNSGSKQLPSEEVALDDSFVNVINCGPGLTIPANDPGMKNSVRFNGNTSYRISNATIIGEDVLFTNLGKSFRWSNEDFEYDIVPKKAKEVGLWDVAVVLCETDHTCFVKGKRLITIEVVGKDFHKIENIDVFKEVGAYRTKVVRVRGLNLGSRPDMTVRIIKSGTAAAMISGIIVAPSLLKHPLMEEKPIPTAFVNCGVFGAVNRLYDGGVSENVEFTPLGIYGNGIPRMTGNLMLRDMCSVMRTGAYKYTVNVGSPGKYDVFLIFAELFYNAADTRVFNIEVKGKETHEVKDIDVFAEVGKYRPFILQLTNIEAESAIVIEGKAVKAVPMISGILIHAAGVIERSGMPRFVADELVDAQNKSIPRLPKYLPLADGSSVADVTQDIDEDDPLLVALVNCGSETASETVSLTGWTESDAEYIAAYRRSEIIESGEWKRELSYTYRKTKSGPFGYNIRSLKKGMYRVDLIFCECEEQSLRRFPVSLQANEEVKFTVSFTESDYMKVKVVSSVIQVDSSIAIRVNASEQGEGFLNGVAVLLVDEL
eukprot:TRINITY_DN677_c0_g1_i7.p1 TRINITY_DN677_c0_g1~~TRINITY_DN677_c0_g1_i7.p1  ORF type:complete len:909 (-),score=134.42 TRINITY_DN677_c0_g1_i7:1431-4157(-)